MQSIVLGACLEIRATRALHLAQVAQVVRPRTALAVCRATQGMKARLVVVRRAGGVRAALAMMATSTRQWTALAACQEMQGTKARLVVAQGAGAGHLVCLGMM